MGLVTTATAIIGIAIVATLVSQHAQTPEVLQAAGKAFGGAISAAVSPITGGSGAAIGYSPTSLMGLPQSGQQLFV
jgi:cephalosporin-C deacetylase-like acetyl esterase